MTLDERIARLERNYIALFKSQERVYAFMEGVCEKCDEIGVKLERLDVDKIVKALANKREKK